MDNDKRRLKDAAYNSEFKKRLREKFCIDRKTILNLAAHLDISEQSVRDYMSGNVFPKTENLIKIAEFFNCSLDYLVGLSDVSSPDAETRAINEQTGLSQKAIEVLRFLNTAGEDDEDRREHHKIISLINEVLEDSSGLISRFEEKGFPLSNVFSTMMDYLHPGEVMLSFRDQKTEEHIEVQSEFVTLEVGGALNGYTLKELAPRLSIERIQKQLDGLRNKEAE